MKPTPQSSHALPPCPQLSLPLHSTPISELNAKDRASVIAVLARLLLEAALAWSEHGADDAAR
jgi:hypothetical protein